MNKISKSTLVILITSLIIPLFGQTEAVRPLPLNTIAEIENPDKLFRPRGGSVDWGLALSGGGIRSGSYSVGVMKALYDYDFFEKIDAISTVSGGGFASYWLYGQYDPDDARFAESAFGNKLFLRNTCRLMSESQMYGLGKMFKSLFLKRHRAFDDYRNNIHRTFGPRDQDSKNRRIDFVRDAISMGRVPYFFVNASLHTGELADFAKTIEITPDHIGNPVLGYSRWADGGAINFSKSITISAAGNAKVRNEVENFAPHTLCVKDPSTGDHKDELGRTACVRGKLQLWDGGYSENLAALPLIRRGIKNVLIVDAEHDPSFIYDAYFDLKRILASIRIDICVSGIEKCESQIYSSPGETGGVMTGLAKNNVTGAVTKIFYLKMMRPNNIFPPGTEAKIEKLTGKNEREAFILNEYKDGFLADKERDKKIGKEPNKKNVTCDSAIDWPLDPEMYKYLVNRYAYFILQSKLRKISEKGGRDAIYDFPHTTTWDQSYFPDQMEAFIGLGFLQGRFLSDLADRED